MNRMRFSSDMPKSLDMKTAFNNANTTTSGTVSCRIVDSRYLCVRNVWKEMTVWSFLSQNWPSLTTACRRMKPAVSLGTATATLKHSTVVLKETKKGRWCFLSWPASCSFNATNFFQVLFWQIFMPNSGWIHIQFISWFVCGCGGSSLVTRHTHLWSLKGNSLLARRDDKVSSEYTVLCLMLSGVILMGYRKERGPFQTWWNTYCRVRCRHQYKD